MIVQKAPSMGTNINQVASQYLNTQKLVGDDEAVLVCEHGQMGCTHVVMGEEAWG